MSDSDRNKGIVEIFQCFVIPIFLSLFLVDMAKATDDLLYVEAQGIAGYSSDLNKAIFYSQNPDAEMQKPSLGFDYIKRFSGESGDVAAFALQARLALVVDPRKDEVTLEPQVYNAYFKLKTPGPYVWVGHNRPAFGLSSYFDSHALLLRTLAIQGFGYDRDWGIGFYKDFSWGDLSGTATTGSGMPIYFRGNYMTAARVSYGVLSQDNWNLGLSLGYGNTLETMGYTLLTREPRRMALGGIDLTLLRDNFEHRFDFLAGQWLGEETYAMLYRFGINLGEEGRLKLEAQPMFWRFGGENNYQMSLCFSFLATSNLTLRAAYTYDHNAQDNMVVLQLYYYRPVSWLSELAEMFKKGGRELN
jgi:hypothetical protein